LSGKLRQHSSVFSIRLKTNSDGADVTSAGKLFQTRAASTEMIWHLNLESNIRNSHLLLDSALVSIAVTMRSVSSAGECDMYVQVSHDARHRRRKIYLIGISMVATTSIVVSTIIGVLVTS